MPALLPFGEKTASGLVAKGLRILQTRSELQHLCVCLVLPSEVPREAGTETFRGEPASPLVLLEPGTRPGLGTQGVLSPVGVP